MNGKTATIALVGNPNVGKSTVFNALTGLHQHTGNWPGKTVAGAVGIFYHKGQKYKLVDTPGTYSLFPHSKEEEVTASYILGGDADLCVVVCDATALQRSLYLCLQVIAHYANTVVCINLIDEAQKNGIGINITRLQNMLQVPVVAISAKNNQGLDQLKSKIEKISILLQEKTNFQNRICIGKSEEEIMRCAKELTQSCVTEKIKRFHSDPLLKKPYAMLLLMPAILAFLFWITIVGANVPTQVLFKAFNTVQQWLFLLFNKLNAPAFATGILVEGAFGVMGYVVSVMLPPMAIFFPVFSLMEDMGLLPRIAFYLDAPFQVCGACGKQALCMCMGLGCNAAGVVGCRIIDSHRERNLAILTNAFIPCNGRFPTLIALAAVLANALHLTSFGTLVAASAVFVAVLLGVIATFATTAILNKTLFRGKSSSYTFEIPPYRSPKWGQALMRSLLDRTVFVLGRAVAVAAPAGAILWLCANTFVAGQPIIGWISAALNPVGELLGMNGGLLTGFLFGLPANEIVLPIASLVSNGASTLMLGSDAVLSIFADNPVIVVCTMVFCVFHWPCSTTLISVYRETGKWCYTALAAAIPTVIGVIICFILNIVL